MLNKKFIFQAMLLFCAFLLAPGISLASPSSDLMAILNNIKSMKANFTQTVYDNHNKPVQVSNGKMLLQRPGKFRWEVTKPIPQLIIANESTLWIYDPDLEQVTIRSLSTAAGESPALFLSHTNITLDKEYDVSHNPQHNSKLDWYVLKPKKADSMFLSIQMGFKNNQISEMKLEDHIGHITKIEFRQIENNISIASSQFIFKPPAGIDVIDETKQNP